MIAFTLTPPLPVCHLIHTQAFLLALSTSTVLADPSRSLTGADSGKKKTYVSWMVGSFFKGCGIPP